MKLKDIGEFGLIDRISKKIKIRSKDILTGIGDDAAAFRADNSIILLTSDILIENVHFTLQSAKSFQIGYKAIASSISDIAAMAGVPKYAVISIGLKSSTTINFVDELYKGIENCCSQYRVTVVGGDTVFSPTCIVLNVSLIGEVEAKNMVRRNGAKPGDKVYVTGFLGDASLGLEINKFFMPVPRIEEARVLVKSCKISSMIDISDGLANEINHIARESNVGAVIYKDRLPFSKFFLSSVAKLKRNPFDFALYGGEDYELLFTSGDAKMKEISEIVKKKTGTKITLIGEIVKKKSRVKIIDEEGREEKLEPEAYQHFKSNVIATTSEKCGGKQTRTNNKFT